MRRARTARSVSFAIAPTRFDPKAIPAESFFDKRQAGVVHKFRLAMMTGGVDFSGSPGGITSATHGEAELEDTLTALRKAIRMLKQESEI
jgi:glutamate-1-semialdehyde aminotransferase